MSDLGGAGWVAGAIGLLTAVVHLYRTRAVNEGKRLEKEMDAFGMVQEQIRTLKAENDFQAVQMDQLRAAETRAQIERAELALKLTIAQKDAAELARVEQELEDEKRRSEAFARELAEMKRAAASLGSATVTPLRPPKKEGA